MNVKSPIEELMITVKLHDCASILVRIVSPHGQ